VLALLAALIALARRRTPSGNRLTA
jgi:hypothetical protein